jgi:predicted glycosyltransferase
MSLASAETVVAQSLSGGQKLIWIDLDNSPHVPFFAPIMRELMQCGYRIHLTARDCSQTCALADLFHLKYRRIGRHYGKNKLMKVWGTVARAMQLCAAAPKEKPNLAVSHGSRSQLLAATGLRIPSMVIIDYEFASAMPGVTPTWVMVPEVIPINAVAFHGKHIVQYPGIKEDIYVPEFTPDPNVRQILGIDATASIVTVRPPATEAHYHNPESEGLLDAVVKVLSERPNTTMVVLPRNERQGAVMRQQYQQLIAGRIMIIPDQVIDGLTLIWESDAVVSGGGTMNREAAAMGVPVYSIFRGPTGAVDRYLTASGRLVMLRSVEEIQTKLLVMARDRSRPSQLGNRATLGSVVGHILHAVESMACQEEKKAR